MRSGSDFSRCWLPLALNLDIHINQRYRGRRHSRNTNCVSQRARTDAGELFVHLAREAAYLRVVEPFWDCALFRFLQALDGSLLLLEIAGVLDLRFHRLQFVARLRGKMLWRCRIAGFEECRHEFLKSRSEHLNRDFRTLQ